MGTTECKWCGCSDIERETPVMQSVIVTFACGTMSDTDASGTTWRREVRCAGAIGDLYRRIRRATKTLKAAERYDTDEVDPDTWLGYRGVAQAVDADIVDQVIQILEGKSDETD